MHGKVYSMLLDPSHMGVALTCVMHSDLRPSVSKIHLKYSLWSKIKPLYLFDVLDRGQGKI